MAANDESEAGSADLGAAKPSNGHPVADNPFRLLHGSGWTGIRDLLKTGQRLKLLARHGPITPEEPCPQFCPRQRTADDYALAARQLADPNDCAVALVFTPDAWEEPATSMGRALLALLEAEHLPAEDERKAALLNQAILVWEGPETDPWMTQAVATARERFNLEPDQGEVSVRASQALARVAEAALANLGAAIAPSNLELLSTLENCRRLPEIRGLIAGAEVIGEQQFEAIRLYLNHAIALQHESDFFARGAISEFEMDELVKQCAEAKRAYALLQQRPSLARRLDPRVARDLAVLTVGIAFTLGLRRGRWQEAGVMIFGLSLDDMLAGVVPERRVQFQLALAATPLMVQAVRREDLFSLPGQLEDLRYRYDGCDGIINIMKDQVAWLESGHSLDSWRLRSPEPVTSYSQVIKPGSSQSGYRGSAWAIFVVLFLLSRVLTNCSSNYSSTSSSYSRSSPLGYPYSQPSRPPPTLLKDQSPLAGRPRITLLSTGAPAESIAWASNLTVQSTRTAMPLEKADPLAGLVPSGNDLAAKLVNWQILSNTLRVERHAIWSAQVASTRNPEAAEAFKKRLNRYQEAERQLQLLQKECDNLLRTSTNSSEPLRQ